MKFRNILMALLSLTALFSCNRLENNHCDLLLPKELSVVNTSYSIPWEGATLDLSFTTNSYWGVEFLGWKEEVVVEGDTTRYLAPVVWMSTPITCGKGDASIGISFSPNNKSTKNREGYIKVFTGDENVFTIVPVVQAGNPDYVPEPITLTFDFTKNFMNWPTTDSAGEYEYLLDYESYTFEIGAARFGGAYLVVTNTGSYLGFPKIPNYRLTRATILISSNNKSERHALISMDPQGYDVASPEQTWPAKPSVNMVYDIQAPEYNTRYYLYCVSAGLPVAGVTLQYEPKN